MATYTPRLSDAGMANNRLWYSDNPFYTNGYGLPNCTCYCWGRFWEIAGGGSDTRPNLSTGNAEDWWGASDGYSRGSTPALGATLCLADGPYSGEGHVATVEEIFPDGSITVSESAWGYYYFKTERLYPPYYLTATGYIFQGFIYNPYAGSTPVPPIPPAKRGIFIFKKKLWLIEKDLY